MKIGILQCDDVQEQLQPEHGNYPEMFINLFHTVDPTLNFATYRVMESEFPVSINECDTWLITGSRYSVYNDLEWIPLLEAFICELYQHEKKLIGICFGHQIMAQALGGRIEKSDKGWGVGKSVNKITSTRRWMSPESKNIAILVSHQDQITQLPENTEILASSDFCPFYMLQYSSNFLSIQGHPEFNKDYSQALMESRRNHIPHLIIRKGIESIKKSDIDNKLLSNWIINFLNSSTTGASKML